MPPRAGSVWLAGVFGCLALAGTADGFSVAAAPRLGSLKKSACETAWKATSGNNPRARGRAGWGGSPGEASHHGCFIGCSRAALHSRFGPAASRRGLSVGIRQGGAGTGTIRMSGGGDEWMFVDAKFQGSDRSGMPMSVLTPTFGDLLLVGQEKTLQLTRAADHLLVRRAIEAGSDVAYAVGVASTSRASPNSQGFMAGTVASRLQILSTSEDKSRGALSCVCRAVGRVRIRNVNHMSPFVSATVAHVQDKPPTKDQWVRLDDVQGRVSKLFEECQQLYRSATERTLSSRLGSLESQGFMLTLSEEDHLDLLRRARASGGGGGSGAPPAVGATVAGITGADQLFGGGNLVEDVVNVLTWQGAGEGDARLRRAEIHSFLTLRAGGLSNEELREFLAGDSVMDRSLMALERLESQRDRLRAVVALSGLG